MVNITLVTLLVFRMFIVLYITRSFLRSNSGRKVFITILKNEILFKKFRFLEGIIKMLPHQHMTEKEHLIVCLRVINRHHHAAFNKININLHFL